MSDPDSGHHLDPESAMIAEVILRQFGVKYNPRYLSSLLKKMGLSYQWAGEMHEFLMELYEHAAGNCSGSSESGKAALKVSGGFRTADGARVFARLQAVISTFRKQGENILVRLQKLFASTPAVAVQ